MCRDPWVLPTEASARRAAALVRSRLSREAGGASDHLATVKAFNGWKAAKAVGAVFSPFFPFLSVIFCAPCSSLCSGDRGMF
jgi:hypothetical protein